MNWSAWAVELVEPSARTVHVLVSAEEQLSANDGGPLSPRAPVMVNLVLDRSGSMKGAPLGAAVEAAQQFVELSTPDDFLGLLVFDGIAEQRVPLTLMDAKGKAQMAHALSNIDTGRGTALYQAVEQGARALQRVLVPGRRPRLLLLTDGEPSVGADTQDAFDALGQRLAGEGISVHALGLARHYVAEILAALCLPSGNAFEHVDGPEGLSEAMGSVASRLYGEVAHGASLRVQPKGFVSLTSRHGYPTHAEKDALHISLGDVSQGLARRVLLTGRATDESWQVAVGAVATLRRPNDAAPFEERRDELSVERVAPDSARGKLVLSVDRELELVAAETAAWLSLARRDVPRAEAQLKEAEAALVGLTELGALPIPTQRHRQRLADLRGAVERGEGDIPLLIRRAQSAQVGTHVSQVIPLAAFRNRR